MSDQHPAPQGPLLLHAASVQDPADLMRYLQGTLARERLSLEDEAVIEAELHHLLTVRRLFLAWMQAGEEGDAPRVTPAQFLRAWNDSVARVIQLLRARRDLAGERGGPWSALMEEVYDQLEEGG